MLLTILISILIAALFIWDIRYLIKNGACAGCSEKKGSSKKGACAGCPGSACCSGHSANISSTIKIKKL